MESTLGNSPADHDQDAGASPVHTPHGQPGDPAAQQAFVPTQMDENAENANDWWSESADGQCSENAALFAASQPAPLSIV